jgi:hypothetical protein
VIVLSIFVVLAVLGVMLCLLYDPKQRLAPGRQCEVTTPDPEKYQNDCVHPCIRRLQDGRYVMVQSPWPAAQDGVENPILYFSEDPATWHDGVVLKDTPATGYNSDPNVFEENGRIYVFWREVDTPRCQKYGKSRMVMGGIVGDDGKMTEEKVYITADADSTDHTICPTLIKHNGKYYFYTLWRRRKSFLRNLGITIWEGTSLENPDFKLIDKVKVNNPLVWDRFFENKFFGRLFFIPVIKRYDLWHFDLFEHDGRLYMVSSDEMDDFVMLSESRDWRHFTTVKTPLLNNNYSDKIVGHRQRFYKPTAQVVDNQLYLWYTYTDGWPYKNKLFLSTIGVEELFKN